MRVKNGWLVKAHTVTRAQNRKTARRTLALLLVGVVAFAARPALGDGFGASANPDHYIADSNFHTWVSTEGTQAHFNYLDPLFDGRMTSQFGNSTDMVVQELGSYTTTVDVYWFATPAVSSSDATCMAWFDAGSTPPKCEQVRVRLPESKIGTIPVDQWRQGICHEVGHSVGFDDSIPESSTGCMSGGPNGVLSTHEINHINGQY